MSELEEILLTAAAKIDAKYNIIAGINNSDYPLIMHIYTNNHRG